MQSTFVTADELHKFDVFEIPTLELFADGYSISHVVMLMQFVFYAPQLYRQVLLRARISYGNSVCPSVCPSVTTRYGFKAR